ncbi:hypothetical protein D3C75_661250 [compost metagenome]
MLEVLNTYKAPVTDAVFTNAPRVGIDATVIEYNTSAKTIRVYGSLVSAIKIGGTVSVVGATTNNGVFTVTNAVAGAVLNSEFTTVITVAESLTANGVEASPDATLLQGTYVPASEQTGLVTRTTLDYEVKSSTKTNYLYTKIVSAGSNVVVNVGFTYTPNVNKLWVFRNGQKLRVNTLTGGDYNETSSTSITIASVYANDEFEIYKI